MAINSVYRASIVYRRTTGGDLFVNTLHWRANNITIFDTQAEDLAEAILNDVFPVLQSLVSSDLALDELHIVGITDPTEFFDVTSINAGGSLAGTSLANQTTLVCTLQTGLRGRRFRGRIFIPPASETELDDGQFNASYVSSANSGLNSILVIGDGIVTATYDLVVRSVVGAVATVVTNIRANPNPAGQNRRRRGRGV